jgi:serine protease
MKRIFAALAIAFVSVSAFAGQTHTYVVGVRAQRDHHALVKEAIDLDAPALEARNFRDFVYIDQFAADLTDSEAAALRAQSDIRFVEQSMTVHAWETPAIRASFRAAPEFRNQNVQTTPYGIPLVDAPNVWSVTQGFGINVAVIDTGIDYTHPDLASQYAGGFNYVAQPNTTDPKDDNGHGTHVAGTIAAANNFIGVVGVAPQARIWSIKVLDSSGSGSTVAISSGINWVVAKKAEIGGNWIINMSLGICSDPNDPNCTTTPPQSMSTACQKASDAGVLIFAAAGNLDSAFAGVVAPQPIGYPAAFPSVVAVGAVDSNEAVASFSDQGPELAVVAPGVDVLSTFPVGQGTNSYALKSSTPYSADGLTGSKRDSVSGHFVYCGIGASASDFPASVRGNVALIERGQATFNLKTKNAVAAGASAVIIYNCSVTASPATCGNADFSGGWTLIGKVDAAGNPCDPNTNPNCTTDSPADLANPWPVTIRLNNADGLAFRADSNATITAANLADDYQVENGTSMASPHAAGVAALVWSAAPNATANDVRQAIVSTAHHLGAAGQNPVFGFGLVDAVAATKVIAPQFFAPPQPPSGRRFGKRGH